MKDVAKLALYFIAVVIVGALLAPILFWSAQSLAVHEAFSFLARYDFETFFHRAMLIAAALLLWPFLRVSHVRGMADLGLAPNPRWSRDLYTGALLSVIPLLCCGALLIAFHVYSFRHVFAWSRFGTVLTASIGVPFIEEWFFRGIILGVLLRTGRKYMPILAVSALFAAVHFLKAPEQTTVVVTWSSGFNSIGHSLERVGNPMMVASAFVTLFVIGCIFADARVLTRSLWLSIGLHAGWIFGSGTFSLLARQKALALPWLGKNLLVGIVPLGLAAVTWIAMRIWLTNDRASKV
ncbi:MAG: CPBP family intramembrane glutamic endopeptidase [Candidatus Udaeobacter sp.]